MYGKDGKTLNSVLYRADQELIDNTVRRIPAEAVVPLVTTLEKYVKGWRFTLGSNCQEMLGPVYALLEARTGAYSSVLQLRGMLDLVTQTKVGGSRMWRWAWTKMFWLCFRMRIWMNYGDILVLALRILNLLMGMVNRMTFI